MKYVYVNRDGRVSMPLQRLKLPVQKIYLSTPGPSNGVSSQRASMITRIVPQQTTGKQVRTAALPPKRIASPTRSKWNCLICRKSLSSKRSYEEHMNIHNDTRPFQCDHCEYAAASQMTLRRHILRNHTSRLDWGYRCPYCSESYMEPASYQQHVQSRHYGRSATFGCPYMMCPFTSKCLRHFREHLAKHETCEAFAGPPDRPPYSYADDAMNRYLINDEYGYGFSSAKRRVIPHRQKTVLYTNDRICKETRPPISSASSSSSSISSLSGVVGVPNISNMSSINSDADIPERLKQPNEYEFMKQPIRLKPAVAVGGARRVVHQASDYATDDFPPVLMEQELLPDDNEWMVNEVEVQSTELMRLPDGQIDLELD